MRENDSYYVDKTLMIKDFIEMKNEVALIARPRRFGKTLNLTMLKEFFDIETDSRNIFDGLAIMNTEYACQINSSPDSFETKDFYAMIEVLRDSQASHALYSTAIQQLTQFVKEAYVIIEFKQGEDLERLKEEALQQIIKNRYYTGLKGEVICIGLAHDKKKCSINYKVLNI